MRVIKLAILRLKYDYEALEEQQNKIFRSIGFDRMEALELLTAKYKEFPETEDLMSEHHALFAATSLSRDVKTVLEIGTYSASCSKLLSVLFPRAQITTIDLPDDDPVFSDTYGRDEEQSRLDFIERRNKILDSCVNVNFEQKNSLELLFNKKDKYDFIWVDGAHGYPIIAMDIVNAVSHLGRDGLIFIDDVWLKTSSDDANYKSTGAFESITELKRAGIIDFWLIPKRISFPHGKGSLKKYIAKVKHSDFTKEKYHTLP